MSLDRDPDQAIGLLHLAAFEFLEFAVRRLQLKLQSKVSLFPLISSTRRINYSFLVVKLIVVLLSVAHDMSA